MIPERMIYKEDLAHLIGGPRVVLDRDKIATVWIHGAPWGWGSCEKQFLDPQSAGAEVYAAKLRERIRLACEREADRRNRIKSAKFNGGGQ